MKHSTNAKIAPVQLKEDNRFYAEAEIVVPDKFEHIVLFIDNTGREAHASTLSNLEADTHRVSISGEGKPPFEVAQSIMARAFERGELPA
jgi:hypothetical protein